METISNSQFQFDDISEEQPSSSSGNPSFTQPGSSKVLTTQPSTSSSYFRTSSPFVSSASVAAISILPPSSSSLVIPPLSSTSVNEDEIVELPEIEYPAMEPIIIRGEGNITLFGLSNMFSTDFPSMLIGRISKEEFQTSIGKINALLQEHHNTNVKLMLLGCLCCCCSLGCSLLWPTLALSKRTRSCLEKLLAEENERLYHKLGFNWRLGKKACHNNTAFMEYVLVIDYLPKLHMYHPD